MTTERASGMTFTEGTFATLLFEFALLGTNNFLIRFIVKVYTNLTSSWDTRFRSGEQAEERIKDFCQRFNIQYKPWIWGKQIREYTCLNDFFSRTYADMYFPTLGTANLVSPASCTMTRYNDDADLKQILIKGCNYSIEAIGLPSNDIRSYRQNSIFIGYLSPSDYHRIHSPIDGKCTHLQLEKSDDKIYSSALFLGGKFNILNDNKRLVVVLESSSGIKVALVIVGGIGVDTIVYDSSRLLGKDIKKRQELAMFRASSGASSFAGSAFAMFSTIPLQFESQYAECSQQNLPVIIDVGESIANF
jgi:phosphatidylserine decarboxylase